jgi:hypothetical protein
MLPRLSRRRALRRSLIRMLAECGILFSYLWNPPNKIAFTGEITVVEFPMITFEYNSSAARARATQSKSEDYRGRAARCAEQAQDANNATMRRVFEDAARAWSRLVEQAQKDDEAITSRRG